MGRLESSRKNLITGTIYQVLYLVMNFFVRILILKKAGIEALSLNGLFLEVASLLAISELGAGTAISYSLYKPLAERDHDRIASVMRIFKKTYRIIGCTIFLLGLLLMPFLGKLINKMDVDIGFVRLVFLLILIQASVPYFYSYKMLLLNADQKNHIANRINILIRTLFFIAEGLALILTGRYIVYLLIEILYNVCFQIVTSLETDRLYPYLKNAKPLPREQIKEIIRNIRRGFFGKLSNKVLNTTDNILISTLIGTTMVGVYSQYSMLINAFLRLFSQTNTSIVGSVGNLLATETPEYCEHRFRNITWLFFAGGSFVSLCFLAGSSPFIRAVLGKNFQMSYGVLVILAMNLAFEITKMPLWTFFEAGGLFKENQFISVAGAVLNIVTSIVLGKFFGLAGIFAGTFLSLLLMAELKAATLYKKIFLRGARAMFWLYLGIHAADIALVYGFITWNKIENDILAFFVNCIFAAAVSLLSTVVAFWKSPYAADGKRMIARFLHLRRRQKRS